VRVRVGRLRQVVPGALAFGWELVTRGSALEGAALEIEAVPVAARCRGCNTESAQDAFPLRCPVCAGRDLAVVRGEELLVDSLELADPLADAGSGAAAPPPDPEDAWRRAP